MKNDNTFINPYLKDSFETNFDKENNIYNPFNQGNNFGDYQQNYQQTKVTGEADIASEIMGYSDAQEAYNSLNSQSHHTFLHFLETGFKDIVGVLNLPLSLVESTIGAVGIQISKWINPNYSPQQIGNKTNQFIEDYNRSFFGDIWNNGIKSQFVGNGYNGFSLLQDYVGMGAGAKAVSQMDNWNGWAKLSLGLAIDIGTSVGFDALYAGTMKGLDLVRSLMYGGEVSPLKRASKGILWNIMPHLLYGSVKRTYNAWDKYGQILTNAAKDSSNPFFRGASMFNNTAFYIPKQIATTVNQLSKIKDTFFKYGAGTTAKNLENFKQFDGVNNTFRRRGVDIHNTYGKDINSISEMYYSHPEKIPQYWKDIYKQDFGKDIETDIKNKVFSQQQLRKYIFSQDVSHWRALMQHKTTFNLINALFNKNTTQDINGEFYHLTSPFEVGENSELGKRSDLTSSQIRDILENDSQNGEAFKKIFNSLDFMNGRPKFYYTGYNHFSIGITKEGRSNLKKITEFQNENKRSLLDNKWSLYQDGAKDSLNGKSVEEVIDNLSSLERNNLFEKLKNFKKYGPILESTKGYANLTEEEKSIGNELEKGWNNSKKINNNWEKFYQSLPKEQKNLIIKLSKNRITNGLKQYKNNARLISKFSQKMKDLDDIHEYLTISKYFNNMLDKMEDIRLPMDERQIMFKKYFDENPQEEYVQALRKKHNAYNGSMIELATKLDRDLSPSEFINMMTKSSLDNKDLIFDATKTIQEGIEKGLNRSELFQLMKETNFYKIAKQNSNLSTNEFNRIFKNNMVNENELKVRDNFLSKQKQIRQLNDDFEEIKANNEYSKEEKIELLNKVNDEINTLKSQIPSYKPLYSKDFERNSDNWNYRNYRNSSIAKLNATYLRLNLNIYDGMEKVGFNGNSLQELNNFLGYVKNQVEKNFFIKELINDSIKTALNDEQLARHIANPNYYEKGYEKIIISEKNGNKSYFQQWIEQLAGIDNNVSKFINIENGIATASMDSFKVNGQDTTIKEWVQKLIKNNKGKDTPILVPMNISRIAKDTFRNSQNTMKYMNNNIVKILSQYINFFKRGSLLNAGIHLKILLQNFINTIMWGVHPKLYFENFYKTAMLFRDWNRLGGQKKLDDLLLDISSKNKDLPTNEILNKVRQSISSEKDKKFLDVWDKLNEYKNANLINERGTTRASTIEDLSTNYHNQNLGIVHNLFGPFSTIVNSFKRITNLSMNTIGMFDNINRITTYEALKQSPHIFNQFTTRNVSGYFNKDYTNGKINFQDLSEAEKRIAIINHTNFINANYSEIGAFNKGFMKIFFPFYVFQTKNIYRTLLGIATNPRFGRFLQQIWNTNNYLNDSQKMELPSYILSSAQIPFFTKNGGIFTVSAFHLPALDTYTLFSPQTLFNTNPFIKAMYSAFYNKDISDDEKSTWYGNFIPNAFNNATNNALWLYGLASHKNVYNPVTNKQIAPTFSQPFHSIFTYYDKNQLESITRYNFTNVLKQLLMKMNYGQYLTYLRLNNRFRQTLNPYSYRL